MYYSLISTSRFCKIKFLSHSSKMFFSSDASVFPRPVSRFNYQKDIFLSNIQLVNIVKILFNQVLLFSSTKQVAMSASNWKSMSYFLAFHLYVKLYKFKNPTRVIEVSAFLQGMPTYRGFLRLASEVTQFQSDGQTRVCLLFSEDYCSELDSIDLNQFRNTMYGIQSMLRRGNIYETPYVELQNAKSVGFFPILGYQCKEKERESLNSIIDNINIENESIQFEVDKKKVPIELNSVSIFNCNIFTSINTLNNKNRALLIFCLLQYYTKTDESSRNIDCEILFSHSNEITFNSKTILNQLIFDAWVFLLENGPRFQVNQKSINERVVEPDNSESRVNMDSRIFGNVTESLLSLVSTKYPAELLELAILAAHILTNKKHILAGVTSPGLNPSG